MTTDIFAKGIVGAIWVVGRTFEETEVFGAWTTWLETFLWDENLFGTYMQIKIIWFYLFIIWFLCLACHWKGLGLSYSNIRCLLSNNRVSDWLILRRFNIRCNSCWRLCWICDLSCKFSGLQRHFRPSDCINTTFIWNFLTIFLVSSHYLAWGSSIRVSLRCLGRWCWLILKAEPFELLCDISNLSTLYLDCCDGARAKILDRGSEDCNWSWLYWQLRWYHYYKLSQITSC